MKASDLTPHPQNWRLHPNHQLDALTATLEEIGFAGCPIARETPDGLQLIDGHARVDLCGDAEIPILIVDLDEQEANKMLASYDPISAMAGTDEDKLADLLAHLQDVGEGFAAFVGELQPPLPDNRDIDEDKLAETKNTCPECGFQW